MNISDMLSARFGNAQPAEDDLTKSAQAEWLVKAAAANGVDLTTASDADLLSLYGQVFGKTAEDESKEEDEKKKKLEEAQKEHEEKKAAAELFAQADAYGRIQARAYADELAKIAADTNRTTGGVQHGVDASAGSGRGMHSTGGGNASGGHATTRSSAQFSSGHGGTSAQTTGEYLKNKAESTAANLKNKAMSLAAKHPEVLLHLNEHKNKYLAGGALAAGGLAAAAAAHHYNKKESAFNEVAAELAIEKAAAAGYDPNAVADFLISVLPQVTTDHTAKVAAAPDFETALHTRACELLELGGVRINW